MQIVARQLQQLDYNNGNGDVFCVVRAIRTLDKRPSIFITDKPKFRQRGCYIRIITAKVQLKKFLVVGLKGLDIKTNRLAVNHQS
jgi:hypothetical protein